MSDNVYRSHNLDDAASAVKQQESRNTHFMHGMRAHLTNIHEAVVTGKMSKEEAVGKYPEYRPDKVVGTYKRKDGKTWNKTNAHVWSDAVKKRQKRQNSGG